MHIPKISIIVPVYNVEKYLDNCINSILKQTYNDFEVLLINDGSTDNSGKICEFYAQKDNRLIVKHTDNHGLSAARNLGILLSKGEFITFIDSDDYVSEDFLEYITFIQNKTHADIVSISHITTNKLVLNKHKNHINKINIYNTNDALYYYLYSLVAYKNDEASAWGKLFKRKIFENIRFPEGKSYEDMVTTFKAIMKAHLYVKSDKTCYFYFMRDSSVIRSEFNIKDFDLLQQAEILLDIAEKINNEKLVKLANIKKIRCSFTLLGKIAYYGINKSISEKDVVSKLLINLKNNYLQQIFSPMSLSRKVILTIMCINWPFAKKCISLYKNIIHGFKK